MFPNDGAVTTQTVYYLLILKIHIDYLEIWYSRKIICLQTQTLSLSGEVKRKENVKTKKYLERKTKHWKRQICLRNAYG